MLRKLLVIIFGGGFICLAGAQTSALINFLLPAKQTKVFWLHNVSQKTIIVNHQSANPGASAGWGSTLHQGNWSLLLLANNNRLPQAFTMNCMDGQTYKLISCSNVVESGMLNNAVVPANLQNNEFWISEDQSLSGLLKGLKQWHIAYTLKQLQTLQKPN